MRLHGIGIIDSLPGFSSALQMECRLSSSLRRLSHEHMAKLGNGALNYLGRSLKTGHFAPRKPPL